MSEVSLSGRGLECEEGGAWCRSLSMGGALIRGGVYRQEETMEGEGCSMPPESAGSVQGGKYWNTLKHPEGACTRGANCPEAGMSVPRRACLSRGGPVFPRQDCRQGMIRGGPLWGGLFRGISEGQIWGLVFRVYGVWFRV